MPFGISDQIVAQFVFVSSALVPRNARVFTKITSTPEVAGDTEAIVSCHVDEWSAFRRSGARLLLKWHRD